MSKFYVPHLYLMIPTEVHTVVKRKELEFIYRYPVTSIHSGNKDNFLELR